MSEMAGRLPPRLARWARYFEAAGAACEVDPYTLAAICDRESLGGEALKPRGPEGLGDGGRGHGLMQIDARYHETFLAAKGPDGRPLWEDPAWNILYGAKLLRMNFDRLGRDYVPAIAAYNASLNRVQNVLSGLDNATSADARVNAFDQLTTGNNYVSDVLARRDKYLSSPPHPTT